MDTNKLYSVIALLDEDSTQTFLSLRREFSVIEGNYNNTLPHITISVYDKGIDLDGLIQWTQQIAENHYKFKVIYSTVGVFLSNCLIAVPSFSKRLYMLYENHHQRYDECCRNYSALKNDEWFPHTGILYTNREIARENIGKLADMFEIIEAEIVSLRITAFDYNVFNKIAEFNLQELSSLS